MTRFPLLSVAALTLLAACESGPERLSDKDRQANQAVSDLWVKHLLAKNLDSVSLLYTEDAVIMPPNQAAVVGREAIRQWQTSMPAMVEFKSTNDVIEGQEDFAYVRGRYSLRMEGIPADSGKYIEVRRREPDGSWKIAVDIFNSSVPLPAPAPPPNARSKAR